VAKRRGPTFIQRSRAVSSAEKAAFHQIAGAGKRRIKRPFFDVTDADERAILDRVGHHLDLIVTRQT
jgi:phage gpG-like protein